LPLAILYVQTKVQVRKQWRRQNEAEAMARPKHTC